MAIIGMDIHRAFAEVVALEGKSRRWLGRIAMRCDRLAAFAAGLTKDDIASRHQQFAMDPRRTPKRVLSAHPPDQIAQLTIELRPPYPTSGLPAPKRFEAGAMPSQNGLRLHHLGCAEQARPNPRHPSQQRPVNTAQAQPMWRLPQCTGSRLQAGTAT
jgi:hypothetical protein